MRVLNIFLLILWTGLASGQAKVIMSVDQDTLTIGDQFVISYEFDVDQDIDAIDFSALAEVENLYYEIDTVMADEFVNIEILNSSVGDIANNPIVPYGKIMQAGNAVKIKASVYDIGVMTLPKPVMLQGEYKRTFDDVETPTIIVKPPENMAKLDSINMNPIKDIIEEPSDWRDYKKYIFGLIGILLLGALIYYLWSRSNKGVEEEKPVVVEEEVIIPADVIALDKLKDLDAKQLWQQGKEKEYHSELTFVLREYLEHRYDFPALENTTSEIMKSDQLRSLTSDQSSTLENVLNIADVIKFAKGEAGASINDQFMKDAVRFVNETKVVRQQ